MFTGLKISAAWCYTNTGNWIFPNIVFLIELLMPMEGIVLPNRVQHGPPFAALEGNGPAQSASNMVSWSSSNPIEEKNTPPGERELHVFHWF